MHTTALTVKVGEHTAILYYSSRCHAGENLQRLLDKREAGLAKPLVMSDALSSNEVGDESLLIPVPLPGAWASQVQRLGSGVSPRVPGGARRHQASVRPRRASA